MHYPRLMVLQDGKRYTDTHTGWFPTSSRHCRKYSTLRQLRHYTELSPVHCVFLSFSINVCQHTLSYSNSYSLNEEVTRVQTCMPDKTHLNHRVTLIMWYEIVYGQLSMDSCPWTVVYGQLSMDSCLWTVVYGQLSVESCLWRVVYGELSMNGCLWTVVYEVFTQIV